ncbi:hypothetical protein [Enterobacter hormaechei]|uniref:hypothetical protein n=1 Tax=Enterobacter hormaechei TaxID=158836 RepID=UPI00115E393F|nr:hypothetical protein [Enterobacter hormaechei]
MLDTQGQIDAFKSLQRAGLNTPATVTLSKKIESMATSQATAIGLLMQSGVSYPASINAYTSQLSVFGESLAQAASAASALSAAISPYCTPSDLLQMKLGWECHVKANSLGESEPFPLVIGMGDTETPQALELRVSELDIGELQAAMAAINSKLSASASTSAGDGAGAGGATVQPSFSDEEIAALKTAVESAAAVTNEIITETNATRTAASKISESTALAAASLQSAVAITLTNSMMADQAIFPALSLLMPVGVIESLKEELV